MPSQEYFERKQEYIKKYQKENYKLIAIKLRKDADKDLLEALQQSGNISNFCKKALRYYLEKGGE